MNAEAWQQLLPVMLACCHNAADIHALFLPPAQQVTVLCNDCSHRTQCTFHVVGHKCGQCGGYNTRRVGGGETAPPAALAPAQ